MTVYVVETVIGPKGSPVCNTDPAERYGKRRVLHVADQTEGRRKRTQEAIDAAARDVVDGLTDFTQDDYLLLIGDPCLIGVAAAEGARRTGGRLRFLVWNDIERTYYPVSVDLNHAPEKG